MIYPIKGIRGFFAKRLINEEHYNLMAGILAICKNAPSYRRTLYSDSIKWLSQNIIKYENELPVQEVHSDDNSTNLTAFALLHTLKSKGLITIEKNEEVEADHYIVTTKLEGIEYMNDFLKTPSLFNLWYIQNKDGVHGVLLPALISFVVSIMVSLLTRLPK